VAAVVVAIALVGAVGGCRSAEDDSRPASGGAPPREDTGPDAGGSAEPGVCYQAPRSDDAGGRITFTDATGELGLAEPLAGLYGHAVATGDVDGDGWPDLFVSGFADKGTPGGSADRLLRGGPDGFTLDRSFPAAPGRTSGAAFADLDGDGDLDLALSRNYRDREGGRAPSVVLRNDDGRFVAATTLDERRGGRSLGVLDYDGDGRLDLLLVEDRFSGGSSVLLHNDGDLRFSDATAEAGLPDDVQGLGVAVADLNDDARPDVFVAGSNRLFMNDSGSFRESDSSVFEWETFGDEDDPAGVAVGDVDRDGRPDLVLGQHFNSTLDQRVEVPVRLFLNAGNAADGSPEFRDVTEDAGLVGLPTKAPHVELADLDSDGWLDILTTASAGGGNRPAVFRHLGVTDGVPRFETPEGLGDPHYWIAGATFDADRDGRLDIFLVEFEQQRTSPLLRNGSDTGHWLAVQVGASGADGVGAAVEVYRSGGLGERSQLLGAREITASTGFGSGSLPVARFGLDGEAEVDVRVDARTGDPIELRGVTADRLIDVAATDAACRG
jgi:hypothetical protein